MAAAPPPPTPPLPPPSDVVTQLQEEISNVCFVMFNCMGALQRDAPPVSVRDEPVLAGPGQAASSNYDVDGQTTAMAEQIAESLDRLKRVIEALPEIRDTAAEQEATIVALGQERAKAAQEHRTALDRLEEHWAEAHALHAALDDGLLRSGAR